MPLQVDILKQIDGVLAKHYELLARPKHDDCSESPTSLGFSMSLSAYETSGVDPFELCTA